jgi:deazaflavin-dependent oxidoreductase (nitroreductase family)
MNREVRTALAEDQVIDITTNGRQSGRPRRIEIGFHNLDGRIFVTGTPGPRSWYANLLANPDLTFHLKRSTKADLPARARAITDEAERRVVLERILANLDRPGDLESWTEGSPLVEVELRVEAA